MKMKTDKKGASTYPQWHGLTRNVLIAVGLVGAITWWGGLSAPLVSAQDNEEIFTPYLVASLLPSGQGPVADSRFEVASLADTASDQPIPVRTGIRLIKQGEYAKAIALLEPYRAEQDFLTLHALGVAYVRTQRNAEAYDILLRAHKLNPEVAGPLLPAALACARMATRCDEYRRFAQEYLALGGKFKKFAEKIANHLPFTLVLPRRS